MARKNSDSLPPFHEQYSSAQYDESSIDLHGTSAPSEAVSSPAGHRRLAGLVVQRISTSTDHDRLEPYHEDEVKTLVGTGCSTNVPPRTLSIATRKDDNLVAPVSESTPLILDGGAEAQRADSMVAGNVQGNIRLPQSNPVSQPSCWKRYKFRLLITILVVAMAIGLVFWSIIVKSTSLPTFPIFPGDVIYVDKVEGFWYNMISLTFSPPPDTITRRETLGPEQFQLYYNEHSPTQQLVTEGNSSEKNYFFPEVIPVNNSDQNYLLKHSQVEFNFTVMNFSHELAELAKVCQFSDIDDFDTITDNPTNTTIIATEKHGICQPLLNPPNKFEIHHSGYYWYVVSTLNGVNVQASYEYRLKKLYYNRTMLGTPHNCTSVDSECVIGSIFLQRSTKHLLLSLTNSDSVDPYMGTAEKTNAVGIALVVFFSLEFITVMIFIIIIILLCCVYKYKK